MVKSNFELYISVIINVTLGYITGVLIFKYLIYEIILRDKYHGPNSNIVRQKIYNYGNTCYEFTPEIYMCGTN
jgi:hypothetical protein